jgi:IS1 family transposase
MRYGRILKKEKNITEKDSNEYGDVYTLTAINTDTRLFVCHHEGDRTTEDAIELFGDVERRRSIHSQIPVFTSDNWDPFEEGLLNIYGFLEIPTYKGIGRKPLPLLHPYPNLKYAQVCKRKEKGRVVEVVQRVVFGDSREVMRLLGADSGGKINTSYIERFNLTIRNSLARFIRRGMNCSKNRQLHSHAVDFFQAWYNFVKPHLSLRLEVNLGRKRWMQRTPAMAEGVTDHVWSLKELLTVRVLIQ